jgi:hypothetical protein
VGLAVSFKSQGIILLPSYNFSEGVIILVAGCKFAIIRTCKQQVDSLQDGRGGVFVQQDP